MRTVLSLSLLTRVVAETIIRLESEKTDWGQTMKKPSS